MALEPRGVSGPPTKMMTAADAVDRIPDGASIVVDGLCMMGVAELVLEEIERSYLDTGHPRNLTVIHSAAPTDGVGGIERLAHVGLVRRVIGSHWGLMPKMSRLLAAGELESICLPQGQLARLFRSIASGAPGHLSAIGLGTFVDPRLEGGRVSEPARQLDADTFVSLLEVDGCEYLFYRTIPIDVAIIRATECDTEGNCSSDEEAVFLDSLSIAQAARNSGGIVICQAKKVVRAGTIVPRDVTVPGTIVDCVVEVEDVARYHRQTVSAVLDPRLVQPAALVGPVSPGERATNPVLDRIGRWAVEFVRDGDVINIGTGVPGESVPSALARAGLIDRLTLTIESGVYGGLPMGGFDFGTSIGPRSIIPQAAQFDFYNGGGLDVAFVGAGQIDEHGNVNVSSLGDRIVGIGGFIDITQSARRVCFCFTAGGRHRKFVERVDHLSFSAQRALAGGTEVFYICESAILRLEHDGLVVVRLAEGVSLEQLQSITPFPLAMGSEVLPTATR